MSVPRGTDRFPSRPALTVVFICAVAFWAACAVAYSTGDVRADEASARLLAASAAALLAALVASFFGRARFAGLVIASIAAGSLLGCSQAAFIHASAQALADAEEAHVELEVLEDSSNYGFGENALVRASIDGAQPAMFTAKLGECGPLLAGERIIASVRFKEVDFGADRFAWSDGSSGSLAGTVVGKADLPAPLGWLVGFRRAAIDGIGASDIEHALLQALVCGYRANVRGTELFEDFQTCGLAHLVAVSGAHLVIVTGLFAALLKRLRAPRKATIAVLIVTMASYYVVSGMPVSALRATIMSSLGLLAYFGKRRPASLNAVGIGLLAIVTASPSSSVSASLALSALSTIGIVVFGPLVQSWLDRTPLARAPFVSDSLSLTLAASILSQPYACSLFSQLPIVAPLANVVTAPLFPLVCGSGLISGVASALLPGSPSLLGSATSGLSWMLVAAVSIMAEIPNASVPVALGTGEALVGSALAALALWCLWPHPSFKLALRSCAVACAAALLLAVPWNVDDRIVMLDVGQGDSILVQSRGQALLIDTGNQDAKLMRALAQNRVTHLDSVLITHADDDHCGSLDQLERAVDVGRVILADQMIACDGSSARALVDQAHRAARETVGVEMGDSFKVGAFTARVVWPRAFTEEGGNADSLCVLLEYDGDADGKADHTALMTGDAEKEELADMIGEGLVGDIDVLKVGHHGSRNGMTSEEVHELAPEIALISCGANNRYGHPTQEILDMLDEAGTRTYRTDLNGSIALKFSSEAIAARCERLP